MLKRHHLRFSGAGPLYDRELYVLNVLGGFKINVKGREFLSSLGNYSSTHLCQHSLRIFMHIAEICNILVRT